MKQTVFKHQFVTEMSKPEHGFSYSGAEALFDYLTELENDTDQELNFDPISFRCVYSEYKNLDEIKRDYNPSKHSFPRIETMDQLMEYTQVIQFNEGIIIQAF